MPLPFGKCDDEGFAALVARKMSEASWNQAYDFRAAPEGDHWTVEKRLKPGRS